MNRTLPPFSSIYTPEVPEILYNAGCTLAISTYQAGKVIFISAVSKDKLIQLARTFDSAMGLAAEENTLAVACKNEVVLLKNAPELAPGYPPKPNTYDALFFPRAVYNTGQLALHDMHWDKQGLLAVNTLFSCLARVDENFSFTPFWQPDFISSLEPEDRCHLNGMAYTGEQVEYVTALSNTDSYQGWRRNKLNGGLLIHVPSGKTILSGLAMPHSPRLYNNKLYLLISAEGLLVEVNKETGKYREVISLGGFARGMAFNGKYLFIGVSRLRHHTGIFSDLPIAQTSFAGVVIVDLEKENIAGTIKYQTSVEEIYDVKILPGMHRPGIIGHTGKNEQAALVSPAGNFWAAPSKKVKQ